MNPYCVVAILVSINLLNYMDRFTIAGVLTEIQKYFEISKSTAGLLQTAFIVSYMVFSPVFGFLGDRFSRKYIIVFGVLFWSIVTLASSFVKPHHTGLFFLFRALVGVGEASYSTVAVTIIADLFVGTQRSTMLAIFYFAIPVGGGLGYIVGISMLHFFGHWTWSLRFTPVLGMVAVFLFLFVKEPERGAIERNNQEAEPVIDHSPRSVRDAVNSWIEDIAYLASIPTYIFTTLGFTAVCFSVGALSWWAPTYMHLADTESTLESVGLKFGVIACVGGLTGVLLGYTGSRFFRPKYPTADAWVCATGVALGVPTITLAIFLARLSPFVAWLNIFLGITFLSTNWSVVVDILLYIIVPRKRSTAQAIQILTSHVLGDAASPFIVGALSDAFVEDDYSNYQALSFGLYLTPMMLIFGVGFFVMSGRYLQRDEHRCKQMLAGSDSSVFVPEDGRQVPSPPLLNQSESGHNLLYDNNNDTHIHQRNNNNDNNRIEDGLIE